MPIQATHFAAIFAILAFMVLVWFVLVKMLFNRLESSHPEKYEAMGSPSLFLRNSPAGTIALLKFLVAREHKILNDSSLSKLSDAMLVFLLIYLVLFSALFSNIVSQIPPHAP
jgi:hypothetical protein